MGRRGLYPRRDSFCDERGIKKTCDGIYHVYKEGLSGAENKMKKADTINRTIAKIIDLLIVGALSMAGAPVGMIAGVVYIMIADGFWNGQSLGKKVIGLRVVRNAPVGTNRDTSFRDSIIRNLPFGAVILLCWVPLIGFLFMILGLAVIGLEAYFAMADDHGIRVGDIFAQTQVINDSK